ncbi:MAG TPA: hypothetical protein VM818_07930 [Vicinamibacterales bacterium]|nr:hypothetical protein [Vicinamibacterales bacterium]
MKQACALFLLLALVACGDDQETTTSPSLAAPPTFQGQYAGSYVVTGCTDTNPGFCQSLGLDAANITLPFALAVNQSQTAVTGTITLGATTLISLSSTSAMVSGTFLGVAQTSGHLTGTATMDRPVPFCATAPVSPSLPGGGGFMICGTTVALTQWDTTIAGNNLSGSFTLAFTATSPIASATASASLLQVSRQ